MSISCKYYKETAILRGTLRHAKDKLRYEEYLIRTTYYQQSIRFFTPFGCLE